MRLTCHRREEGLVCGNVCLNQSVVEKGGGCVTAVYEWIRNLVAFFLFLSVMENLLPGQKYGKYIRLFAGMVLILLVAEPFTSGFDLEEVLARSYENLVLRWEAGELQDDLGCKIPNNGYLKKWADQGVLLLNTVLTVRAHQANSHQGRGWEQFTDAIIQAVNAQDRPIVYMLWGRPAQSKIPMLTNPRHLILKAPHPSPLSAYRGFFGCRHFSQANQFLKEHGIEPIDWQIEDI